MGYRPIRLTRITNPFAEPGNYASLADDHGPAGHHTGIDFAGPIPNVSIAGRLVRSSTPGRVVISEYQTHRDGSSTMGNWVGVYYHRDNVLITYWHLSDRSVKVGERVERGQVIGRVGSTGNSTFAHLHVQANGGREFNYHAHVAPGPWVRGPVFAGTIWFRKRLRDLRRR